jgi:hypothetical protein
VSVKTYDPRQTVASFKDRRASGFADGDMIQATIPDDYVSHQGTDGLVTRIRTNNKIGRVVMRLSQTTDFNDVLSGFRATDLAAPNGDGVGELLVQDLLGRSKLRMNAYILKAPDLTFGAGNAAREWVFEGEITEYFAGGNS